MKKIVVVGAGKIGSTIAEMLAATGDYHVTLVDRAAAQLTAAELPATVATLELDIAEAGGTRSGPGRQVRGAECCALPSDDAHRRSSGQRRRALSRPHRGCRQHPPRQANWRARPRPPSSRNAAWRRASSRSSPTIWPSRFDTLESVRMRVGALPQYPSNALNYNLTWSTDGVINEYCEPCEAIVEGELIEVPPLEEREEFSLDGVTYEAFNTSGGLGTLCRDTEGQGAHAELSHHPLSRPRRDHEGAAQRSWPAPPPRRVEGYF